MVDRVNENFEPYTVEVPLFGPVGCANVNVDFACENTVTGLDGVLIPQEDCAVCPNNMGGTGGVNKGDVLTNKWCKAEEILSIGQVTLV